MGKVTHGAHLWLREGKINPSIRGHRKLQQYLRDLEKDLIADLGGPGSLTAAKEILIKTTIEAYGFILLATMYCKRYSVLRPDKARKNIIELQPVLGHQFIAFTNMVRQNLMALGLEGKTEKLLSPAEVAEEILKEKEKDDK